MSDPVPWQDALAKLRKMGTRGLSAQGNPIVTNREASGLILFARAAAAYGRDHGAPGLAFDGWYPIALHTLGWNTPGDKFLMGEEHQLSSTAPVDAIWTELARLAAQLDTAKVPLAIGVVGSPSGTDSTYRKLAADAWQVMQASDPSSAQAVKPTSTPRTPDAAVTSPSDVETARKKQKDSGSGGGVAIVAALLLLAFADDDNRNSRRRY